MANARRLARKPVNQYHHGDLRRALLEAALRTIQKQGVHALTLRAVGDELGVSRSALYRHFADKSALLAAVAREGFRTLRRELQQAWEHAGKGRAGLDAMGDAYVRFAIAQPSHYRVMFGSGFEREAADAELIEEGTRAFLTLMNALIEEQQQGRVRPDDPEQLANFIWSLVHGIAMLAIDGAFRPGTDAQALTRFALERLRTGIAAALA
ncbi:MAG TPA: TetR/AcrR family transcriptional regulator [Polyangiaceae bacterium]|jgi:AcrR family transcriptional regulator|nr:TetR/AcrR family transcriptional regulator [Polyangiaceae bacterium]